MLNESIETSPCHLVRELHSSVLSFYKTDHLFTRYGEFRDLEEFKAYTQWARDEGVPLFILGNGSNTLFCRKNIKTLVVKNFMAPSIRDLGENRFEISSSVKIATVLKKCLKESRDCFYYLASVPAMIGGALAMNAGRGRQHSLTIFDFVESVTFYDGKDLKVCPVSELPRVYRRTPFTGVQSNLIVSAIFNFPKISLATNPIQDRLKWSEAHQDKVAGNCGSVFSTYDPEIMRRLMDFKIGGAWYSDKTLNWINNRSERSNAIRLLIKAAQTYHWLARKDCALEVIRIS